MNQDCVGWVSNSVSGFENTFDFISLWISDNILHCGESAEIVCVNSRTVSEGKKASKEIKPLSGLSEFNAGFV